MVMDRQVVFLRPDLSECMVLDLNFECLEQGHYHSVKHRSGMDNFSLLDKTGKV